MKDLHQLLYLFTRNLDRCIFELYNVSDVLFFLFVLCPVHTRLHSTMLKKSNVDTNIEMMQASVHRNSAY
jgi:hypothetical protein